MLFKNVKTGSVLVATNETTIALMHDSDTFIKVKEESALKKTPTKIKK